MIPVDIQLTQAQNLEVNKALLTCESLPVPKSIRTLPASGVEGYSLSVGDQVNIVWSSIVVMKGHRCGVVFGTGRTPKSDVSP